MIRPLPTVARLRIREKSLALHAGQSQTCTVQLDRTTNFAGPLRVELVDAPAGVRMEPIVIRAHQTAAVATIAVDEGMAVPASAQLKFRGVGELPRDAKVVSEALLQLTGE
jgi:hypothetical protein